MEERFRKRQVIVAAIQMQMLGGKSDSNTKCDNYNSVRADMRDKGHLSIAHNSNDKGDTAMNDNLSHDSNDKNIPKHANKEDYSNKKFRNIVSNGGTDYMNCLETNLGRAEQLVRDASSCGAQIILLPELFSGHYFCQSYDESLFSCAFSKDVQTNPILSRMQSLARELEVVLPVSFFEADGNVFFNSLVVFDADGTDLGIYRKTHIPDGPGYFEKYYFSPGDTGFKVFDTLFGAIGIGICWDQWFPETARELSLQGAELLLFPTAIGSEPHKPELDSRDHWRAVQCGHAAANMLPVIVSNRVGQEGDMTFYGSSFIANPSGVIVSSADKVSTTVLIHSFDLDTIKFDRSAWGLFRDRRPEMYASIPRLGRNPMVKPSSYMRHEVNKFKVNGTKLVVPASDGYRSFPDFERHDGTILALPFRKDVWRSNAVPAIKQISDLIETVLQHESVYLLVDLRIKKKLVDEITSRFPEKGKTKLNLIRIPYNDIWVRDSGPLFVLPMNKSAREAPRIVDWKFNAWGLVCYADYKDDARITKSLTDIFGVKRYTAPYVLEGGAIEFDGQGTAIVTESCLLDEKRNLNIAKEDFEHSLMVYHNVKKVIWLVRGLDADIDTGGHVDNICRFVAPGKVVLHWCTDKGDPNYAICHSALEILKSSVDGRGRKLEIHNINQPARMVRSVEETQGLQTQLGTLVRSDDDRLPASYINFILVNDAVILPSFNDPENDKLAVKAFETICPDRKIHQLASREILLGGGNFHCITNHVPYLGLENNN